MPALLRRKLIYVLILCCIGLVCSPILAQDISGEGEIPTDLPPTEIPTDIPTAMPTEIPTEIATEPPTATPTEVIPETPTSLPTETAVTETPTPILETATAAATLDATATTTSAVTMPPEPALSLLKRELFESEPLVGWALPAGWTRTAVSDGFALQVDAAAGLDSAASFEGVYNNLAVMGQFTLVDASAQLLIRVSAAGAYLAQLDTSGLVTLAKLDGTGVPIASWNAPAPIDSAATHTLRLSAMGSVLRVAVDDVEVLAINDSAPLPPGSVKVGAHFGIPAAEQPTTGTLLFDNFFLWVPSSEVSLDLPTPLPATPVPTEVVVIPPTPVPTLTTGKSTIPVAPMLVAGPNATGNDDFANRATVNLLYSDSGNTLDNSVEASEPTPSCGFNISRTAWYQFTPSATEPILMSTVGSNFDTMIAVYTGTWGSLTSVACADDFGLASQAQLTTTLNNGVTYYIQLGGYNGGFGDFVFRVMRPADAVVPGAPVVSGSATGAPSTPVVNGGKTNLLRPVLAWNSSGAGVPFDYEIQVSTAMNFSSLTATSIITEPTRFFQIASDLPEPALPAGQLYYWRVRARNFMQMPSAWSTVYNFTLDRSAPLPPTLVSPSLNGTITVPRPMFKWQASAGANTYTIRVTTNFSCSTLVSPLFELLVPGPSFTFPTDLVQGEYWFCVQAWDEAGNLSGFGEKRRFTVNFSLTPAENQVMTVLAPATSANVKFTWTAITGATYHLDVANDSSFTSSVINQDVAGPSYTAVLPFGVYYWRVWVNGNTLPMSLAHAVSVSPPLPAAPLIQPASALQNTSATNDTTPFMDWTVPANWVTPPSGQSITYELQLSTNNTFTALVNPSITGISSSDYEWIATTLPNSPGTVYYWRVRARTNLSLYGTWSAPFSFTLDTSPANPPASLSTPVDNFVSTAARPSFTWTAPAGGAASYRFEISTDSGDFASNTIPDSIVTMPKYTSTVSLPQGTYYWQVWARDVAGNESLTPTGFRTLIVDYRTAPLPNFTAVTAANSKVTFSWVLAAGAQTGTTYTVELDTNLDNTTDQTFTPTTAATFTTPGTGLAQGAYQYRLVVNNGFGTSGWRPFFVSPALPGAPRAPYSPLNNALINNPTPLLTWTAPATNPGAVTGYWVELSTNSAFTAPVAGSPFDAGASTSFTTPLLTSAKYYWRVQAYNSLGAKGVYSVPWYFTVDTNEPNPPASLLTPADTFVSTSARPVFTWAAPVGGATSYRFEIATDFGDFALNTIPDVIVTAPKYTPAFSLPQSTYFWQVWARDAAGNESATPAGFRSVIVDYRTAPAANAIIVPTNNKVTFTWALVTGALSGTTYTVEIDNNSDNNPDITLPAVTVATTSATGLMEGDYRYRLVVNNGYGTSDWYAFYVSPPAPGAPSAPFTPANNNISSNTTPFLSWNTPSLNPGSVSSYLVEIATDKAFTNLLFSSPINVSTALSYVPPALSDGLYYWRVRAKTSVNLFGPYSPVMTFTVDTTPPPAPPVLALPLDNTTTNLPRPVFTWSAAPQANRYVIEIDTENTFSNPLTHTAVVTGTTYPLPTNIYLSQGTYYWRVWTMDAAGNLNLGPISFQTFFVNYAKTPANNGVVISANASKVTFTWSAVPITPVTPNMLRIQIDNENTFAPPLVNSSPLLASNITSYTTTIPLPYGVYYWRVVVSGHPTPPTNTFTVSPAAPPAPVLSSPPAATSDTTPLFSWNAVTSPAGAAVSGYELQLSTANTFASLVGSASVMIAGGATTDFEWVPNLPDSAGQLYYARIRAVNNWGVYGNWSAIRSFTVDTTTPGVPVLTAPADNQIVHTTTPTFTWSAVAGAVRYQIRYATIPDLTGMTPIDVTLPSYKPTVPLAPNNYYWEVRAIDAAGNTIDWNTNATWEPVTNRRAVKVMSS